MTIRTPGAATRWLGPASAVGLILALTACGDDPAPVGDGTPMPPPVISEPDPTATPGPTTDDEPTDAASTPAPQPETPAAPPSFGPAGELASGEPTGGPLLPTDVRVGDHDGYERVVVELVGEGTPGWRVEYVPEAIEDGKGRRIDVDGDAILSVHVSGTRYPEPDEAAYYDGPRVIEGDDVVDEVHYLGVFEGLTQLFIGVDERADFRVTALSDPARLVIDIKDDDD